VSLRGQFATNLFWAAAGSWSREAINFGIFLALARLLGPRSYGIMGMVGIATAIANGLLIDGMTNILVREKKLERGHIDAVFWIQLTIAVAISLLMVACSGILGRLYGEPLVGQILPVMGALPVLYALSGVPSALLQRDLRFRPLTVRSFVAAVVGGVVGISLAIYGAGVWSLVAMAIAQWSTTCLILWTAADWRPGFSATRRQVVDVLRFGVHAVGVKLLVILDQQMPRFIIGATLGATSLGYFTIAWRIIEVLSLLTITPIGSVMVPTLAAVKDDRLRLMDGVGSVMELTAAISLPSYAGLLAVAPVLLLVLTGRAWNGAIEILQLFCAFGITWALLSTVDATMLIMGRMWWRTKFNVFSLALLAVMLSFTYRYGLTAIAATLVVREAVVCAVSLSALFREGLIDGMKLLRRAAPLVAATAIMLGAVLGGERMMESVLRAPIVLALSIAAGAMVFAIAMLTFSRDFPLQVREVVFAFRGRHRTRS
jgi:PST family polysaccharide transporter